MGPRKILEILKHLPKDLTLSYTCYSSRRRTNLKTQLEKCMSSRKTRRVEKSLGRDRDSHKLRNPGLFSEAVRRYCSYSDKFVCSLSRHNYHEEIEAAVNNQISAEFNAGFAYLSMACYFARTDVAMYGAGKFFMKMYHEEIGHALAFINHQNLRGGQVKLCAITTVECSDWCSIHKALEVSLEMEKLVLDKLIDLARIAEKHNDRNTHEVVSSVFIKEGLSSITQLAGLLTRVNRLGICGMSEYLFDKELCSCATHGST